MASVPFKLLDENRLPRHPTPEERRCLSNLFPGQRGLCVLGPFLVITVDYLPSEPWPVHLAGLPLHLTCTDFDTPWELGNPGNPRVRALEQLNAKRRPTRTLYNAVIQYFEERDIGIYELVWITGFWRVKILDPAIDMLPGAICQITVFYILKEAATQTVPQPSVYRTKDPYRTLNDSLYPHLRPGIMVASESLTTTSGVAVSNSAGETFITVPSHGFPNSQLDVHHPRGTDPVIGRVGHRIGDTDIALVRLSPGTTFENVTFSSSVERVGVLLKDFRDPFVFESLSTLSMDTPFTGTTDAIFLTVSLLRIPSDADGEHLWISQIWAWLGQRHPPTDGCCGAALWDYDGYVVGFFGYLLVENNGIGIGAAAEELALQGYQLQCR